MQCKHIDTDTVLRVLHGLSWQPRESVLGGYSPTPRWVLLSEIWMWWNDNVALTPFKVMSAKMGRLEQAGLITGYGGHEYRGDLELTSKGYVRLRQRGLVT